MRIKEKNIEFRNEFQLFNPKELLQWMFSGDWIKGSRFKAYGIKVNYSSDFGKFNNNQIKELKEFFKKYKELLPHNLKYIFNYFIGNLEEEKNEQKRK